MFQMSSGEGIPEELQVSSTLAPSLTVTLDGLSVAMGSTAHKTHKWEVRRGVLVCLCARTCTFVCLYVCVCMCVCMRVRVLGLDERGRKEERREAGINKK